MSFVFSRLFIILLIAGCIPLSLSWNFVSLRWFVVIYDLALVTFAVIDYYISKLPDNLIVKREFNKKFAINDETEIKIAIENKTPKTFHLIVKDEFPPQMRLKGKREARIKVEGQTSASLLYELTPPRRGQFIFGETQIRYLSTLRLIWKQKSVTQRQTVKVYPNLRKAREIEIAALGKQSLVATNRKANLRGEGRDFESMRDYVRGDELRHISWTATARRGKLVARQFQIEKDQNIIIAIDAGRLMTGRIENETKFDNAVQAALALMSAGIRGGDNVGLIVFGRKVKKYLPPKRGSGQLDAAIEALHDIEPEIIEPSYSRALEYISGNCKRRSLIVILTDLVDEEGSSELLKSLKLLRPRHLPLVTTISDRDLRTISQKTPDSAKELFSKSVAEDILQKRETALRKIETLGGLALDVTTKTLAPSLLETYFRVKERGLL
ncbi:MAG: DUF58 domain-containing protein [Pyrinomonadaceae bacterium]|nr:DUF58 domain-containing protein [Pyrinomonadaceae bacterium]